MKQPEFLHSEVDEAVPSERGAGCSEQLQDQLHRTYHSLLDYKGPTLDMTYFETYAKRDLEIFRATFNSAHPNSLIETIADLNCGSKHRYIEIHLSGYPMYFHSYVYAFWKAYSSKRPSKSKYWRGLALRTLLELCGERFDEVSFDSEYFANNAVRDSKEFIRRYNEGHPHKSISDVSEIKVSNRFMTTSIRLGNRLYSLRNYLEKLWIVYGGESRDDPRALSRALVLFVQLVTGEKQEVAEFNKEYFEKYALRDVKEYIAEHNRTNHSYTIDSIESITLRRPLFQTVLVLNRESTSFRLYLKHVFRAHGYTPSREQNMYSRALAILLKHCGVEATKRDTNYFKAHGKEHLQLFVASISKQFSEKHDWSLTALPISTKILQVRAIIDGEDMSFSSYLRRFWAAHGGNSRKEKKVYSRAYEKLLRELGLERERRPVLDNEYYQRESLKDSQKLVVSHNATHPDRQVTSIHEFSTDRKFLSVEIELGPVTVKFGTYLYALWKASGGTSQKDKGWEKKALVIFKNMVKEQETHSVVAGELVPLIEEFNL